MHYKIRIKSTAEALILIIALAMLASSAYADLQINTNFDSGSIGSYTIDNENNEINFTLSMKSLENTDDTYTYWTNFRVTGVSGKKIVFHITNANKVPFLSSTYHESQMVYSCDGESWERLADHSYSAGIYSFSETFNCDEVQIATFFPFSYERMIDYVESVSLNRWATAEILGYSHQGRDISLIEITDSAVPRESKQVIYIIGRQHAAEVTSSHMLQGMIDFLISDDSDATIFRKNYIWYFVPMVNPDGVYLGNSRATSESRDPNRDWGNTNSVEIDKIRSHIETIDAADGIEFFIDWHSQMNSVYWRNYIYGPSGNNFITILSEWTDFDTQVDMPLYNCSPRYCSNLVYTMNNISRDNTFTFEPTPHLASWTQDSLIAEGVNVAFAIDEYLMMSDSEYLGNTQIFENRTTIGNRRAVPYTMPEDGTIMSITMYHEAGDGKMLLGVYADDGQGNPGSQLMVTAETDVSSIDGWQTVKLIEPAFVPAGSRIWLAWVYENNPGLRFQEGSPARAESNEQWNDGMPAAYGPSSYKNYIYSIYANYQPGLATSGSIGNTEVFSNITTRGERRAVPYSMPEDGFIQSASMYHNGGSGKMLLGLYADDGQGRPGILLTMSAETDVRSIAGWQTVNLVEPVYIPADTQIWLAWVYEKNPGIRYQSGMPGRAESSDSWNHGMPSYFSSSSIYDYIYSIYATYDPVL